MNLPPLRPTLCGGLLLAGWLAGGVAPARAARRGEERPVEPKPLRLKWDERYLRVEAEREQEKIVWGTDGTGQDQTLTELRPSLGLGFSGSVYHPNLVSFRGLTEFGLTEGERKLDLLGAGEDTTEDRRFESTRYDLSADLLAKKPFATTLRAVESRDRRDYDRFRSFTTETMEWGVRTALPVPGMPGDISYDDHREDQLDPARPLTRDETTLHLQLARTGDEAHQTRLRATRHTFDQREPERDPYSGDSLSATLSRSDRLGAGERVQSRAEAGYQEVNTSLNGHRLFTLREDLTIRHSETLDSGWRYLFDRRESPGNDVDRHDLDAHAEHRLFESLVSRGGAEARFERASGTSASPSEDRYGPYVSEAYRKKISDWGVLSLGADAKVLEQRIRGATGLRLVEDESVRFGGAPSLLRVADAVPATVVVTDPARGTLYQEGVDYRLVKRGRYLEVQRIFAGGIPADNAVNVDYRASGDGVRAATTAETAASAELSVWERLLVLRLRNRRVDNGGDASTTYPDEAETTATVEFNRGGLSASLEWVDHEADFLAYSGTRAHAQWTRPLGEAAALLLDAARDALDYGEWGGKRDTTRLDASLLLQLAAALRLNLRGGWYREEETGATRTLRVAEAGLEYRIGRLLLTAGAKLEEEDEPGQDRSRRYAHVRATRDF